MKPYLNLQTAEFGPDQFRELVESYEALVEFQEKAVAAKGIFLGDLYYIDFKHWDTSSEEKVYTGRDYIYKGEDEILKDFAEMGTRLNAEIKREQNERESFAKMYMSLRNKRWHKWLYLFYGSCLGLGIAGLWSLL